VIRQASHIWLALIYPRFKTREVIYPNRELGLFRGGILGQNTVVNYNKKNERIDYMKKKDKNNAPGAIKRAANFATAMAKHVQDGLADVSMDEYVKRLETCNACELQKDGVCEHENCGCILSRKAWWRSESCPLDKWPKQD
jgi:hypothetical protein